MPDLIQKRIGTKPIFLCNTVGNVFTIVLDIYKYLYKLIKTNKVGTASFDAIS